MKSEINRLREENKESNEIKSVRRSKKKHKLEKEKKRHLYEIFTAWKMFWSGLCHQVMSEMVTSVSEEPSTLKMEAECSSEITVYTYQITRSLNPEDRFLNKHKRFDIITFSFSLYPTFCSFSQIVCSGFPTIILHNFLYLNYRTSSVLPS